MPVLDLKRLGAVADGLEGIQIKDCAVGDRIAVTTRNTRYVLEVLDPAERRVLVTSDGKKVTTPTEMHVIGITLTGTGTMVKLGFLAVGYRLCIGPLLTSPIVTLERIGTRTLH